MTTSAPSPIFVATVHAPTWKEDSNAIVRMDSLLGLCKFARMLTNVKKWAINALSVVTTCLVHSVVFVRTATRWQRTADTVKTWTNALRRPIIASLLVKI